MSRQLFFTAFLLGTVTSSLALGQITTVSDQFTSAHDYATGAVPAGGIWDGIYNADAGGGGPFDSNTTNPGNLTIPTNGVGWGGAGEDSAPFLFREVDADSFREVRVKVTAVTAGFWSMGGIMVRAAGPLDDDASNDFHTQAGLFNAGEANFGGFGVSPTVQNTQAGAEAELNIDGLMLEDLLYLKLTHDGFGQLTFSTSADGSTWDLRQEYANSGLSGGPLEVGLWGGTFGELADANAVFDWIEIDEGPCPDCAPITDITWTANSGNWGNAASWSIGGPANSNTVTAIFGGSGAAAATVYTNVDRTVKGMRFEQTDTEGSATSYAIAGAGSIIFESDSGPSTLTVLANAGGVETMHEIQADVVLNNDLNANAETNATLQINAAVNLNGNTFSISGAGDINLNNGVFGGGEIVNAGSLAALGAFGGDFSQLASGSLNVDLSSQPLVIDGEATLDGVINLMIPTGFSATYGQTFTVLTAESLSDRGIALSADDASSFQLLVSGNSVSVTAVPEPASALLVAAAFAVCCAGGRRLRFRREL